MFDFFLFIGINSNMGDYLEIIKKRSTPGVLIYDQDERLLFANSEAAGMIPDLTKGMTASGTGTPLLEEIHCLLKKMTLRLALPTATRLDDLIWPVMESDDGSAWSLRASYLGATGHEHIPTHVMVLVQKVVEKHGVDLDRAGRLFGLSKREQQVLHLICHGLMNKEIGEQLFICEYTVKDHVKKIMKKMGTGSRNEIMAALQ